MKFIELGGYVSFFFSFKLSSKKVKLSENLEKQLQKISWIQPQIFFEIFNCGFFFNNTRHFWNTQESSHT